MRRNGKWSDTMAFKALPLPCPSLFIFYPNKWWSKKQKSKLWNKNTRDQVGLISPSCWTFFFFFLFLLPNKVILGVTNWATLSTSLKSFYKSSSKAQLSEWAVKHQCSGPHPKTVSVISLIQTECDNEFLFMELTSPQFHQSSSIKINAEYLQWGGVSMN